ncbi:MULTISPECIES: glycosyltransferase [unclassified Xanthomonas]|uniref:glycosyltransferase n=1 Tax=unclassified Xanthomonas TaxID=2643310 RepID=UPI0003A4AC62|nr:MULTISPECIES: glycosyltransferase [unclassified Xanthomonas]KAB7768005.1 dolichol-phosphate mannosyltransferase [Xanthomonas sp. LMG 12461]
MRKVVVMPVYEDLEASSKLFLELARMQGPDIYVVAVDDGSVRQPLEISAIEAAALEGVVIKLRRNVGHQRAIAIGLSYVADHFGDDVIVISMDSDGEDTPHSITELVGGLASAEVDVVVATRKSRVESLKFKTFYLVYKLLFSLLSGRKISFGNFMAAKMPAVRRLAAMQELWTHVAAAVLGSKLRVQTCSLDRGARYAGRSKMNFVGLALHGFRALMVFAEDVLVRVGIACTLVAGLSIIGGVAALLLKALGFTTPGWFSLASGILLLVFLQTAALTLIILMMSGMIRSGGVLVAGSYRDFVREVIHARPR